MGTMANSLGTVNSVDRFPLMMGSGIVATGLGLAATTTGSGVEVAAVELTALGGS